MSPADQWALQMTGVVEIAKTSALGITAGDRLFWDANKCVNKPLPLKWETVGQSLMQQPVRQC